MESSTLLSQCYYSPSAFLPHLNKTRTGFLHLQPQKQLPPSSSSLQIKPKGFSTTRRIVAINTHTESSYSSIDVAYWKKDDKEEFAEEKRQELWVKISMMRDRFGVVPGLAAIPVGNYIKESQNYMALKENCEIVGIKLHETPLPDDSTEEQLLNCANRFRQDPFVHYILIPTPLPHHMDEQKILDALSFTTGTDGGFPTPIECHNMQDRDPSSGDVIKRCIEELKSLKFDTRRKSIVVIGHSNIFANTDWLFLHMEQVSVTNIRDSEIDSCKDIIKEADIFILSTTEQYSLRSLMKPGAVMYDIDPMPGLTLARKIISTTFAFAYRRELEHSESRK